MSSLFRYLIFTVLFCICHYSTAQYPHYFVYDDESGLPSNEVYSIVQDQKGMIWIGCDAGLYKFDGVRYIPYHSKAQNSKAISGLTVSNTGRIYCFNFRAQVFYVENDTLRELKGSPPNFISNITCDQKNNVYISYSGGVDIFQEESQTWKVLGNRNLEQISLTNYYSAKTSRSSVNGKVFSLNKGKITALTNQTVENFPTNFFQNESPIMFHCEWYNEKLWIISVEKNRFSTFQNNKIEEFNNIKLKELLNKRKITNVKALADGKLWFCTYKGIITYDSSSEKIELLYPELSFSDVIVDREGNYWFSTLQGGVMRVADLEMKVWNKNSKLFDSDKITQITAGIGCVYFATVNGSIGKINLQTNHLTTFPTSESSDVQSFDFETATNELYININNVLFVVKDDQLIKKGSVPTSAVKTIKQIGKDLFIGSSNGLIINKKFIVKGWIRAFLTLKSEKNVWIATNEGLLKFLKNQRGEWKQSKTFLTNTQILSLNSDLKENVIYGLTFNGTIFKLNEKDQLNTIAKLPENVQGYKLKFFNEKIYVATNKGVWIFDLGNKKWKSISKNSGLASDNIQGLEIIGNSIWLATGRGVQQIPLNTKQHAVKPLIHLKQIKVGSDFSSQKVSKNGIELKNGQSLSLFPEVSSFSSNGNFKFAYRIKGDGENWIQLPSSLEQIIIKNLPFGNFSIELKAIDHNGISSETILIPGFHQAPFWNAWWFRIVFAAICFSIIYFVFRWRIKVIRKNQLKEMERINLENELRISRETALKTQMNPHFIFNVLNSIKAYIYKNDKQNASQYLTSFSDLIRIFLAMSSKATVTLKDELEMLNIYIKLEAMLIHHDFNYSIEIDPSVDQTSIQIPGLILQPFVENAFKHGLHHKVGEKQLTIKLNLDSKGTLLIQIIDNGVGRVASAQMRSKYANHESYATSAIEKRIELINKLESIVQVEIIDLQESDQPSGTMVSLTIKI